MDVPVLIAAVILAFIAAAEVIMLLRCPRVKSFPLTVLIRSDSAELDLKLRYLAYLISLSDGSIGKIIILKCGSDDIQKPVYSRFLAEYPEYTILVSEKNEKFLQKIIDFTEEI